MKNNFFRYPFLAALCLVFAFPLLWMISFSLRLTTLPPPTRLEFFAPPFAFENYSLVMNLLPMVQYTLNSLKVATIAVPLTIVTASLAGFALAQIPARLRKIILALSVALLLVPAPAVWVPRFLIFVQLGWTDSLLPLIAPAIMGTSPFYVILFYIAFSRIPREVFESARLEGASPLQIWFRIAMPMSRPAVIAVAVLSFVSYWSNYIDPLLYLRAEANYTLPVGVQILQQTIKSNAPLLMAGSVIMVAPVVIVFILAQRFFLQEQISLARWLR